MHYLYKTKYTYSIKFIANCLTCLVVIGSEPCEAPLLKRLDMIRSISFGFVTVASSAGYCRFILFLKVLFKVVKPNLIWITDTSKLLMVLCFAMREPQGGLTVQPDTNIPSSKLMECNGKVQYHQPNNNNK